MADERLLGEVMHEFSKSRKNGALIVSVKEASENLFRVFFDSGEIKHVNYGTSSGKDCLDVIDCYSFLKASFMDGLKAPKVSDDLPSTLDIIEMFKRSGKTVEL